VSSVIRRKNGAIYRAFVVNDSVLYHSPSELARGEVQSGESATKNRGLVRVAGDANRALNQTGRPEGVSNGARRYTGENPCRGRCTFLGRPPLPRPSSSPSKRMRHGGSLKLPFGSCFPFSAPFAGEHRIFPSSVCSKTISPGSQTRYPIQTAVYMESPMPHNVSKRRSSSDRDRFAIIAAPQEVIPLADRRRRAILKTARLA